MENQEMVMKKSWIKFLLQSLWVICDIKFGNKNFGCTWSVILPYTNYLSGVNILLHQTCFISKYLLAGKIS